MVTFVKENPQFIEEFRKAYIYTKKEGYTQEKLIESAKKNNMVFAPRKNRECIFGDEDGTLIGQVFDYILRDGGKSKSFKWRFHEYHRLTLNERECFDS